MTEARQIRTVHQVVIALGGEGFRAICACGWLSETKGKRATIVQAGGEHKRRSQPRSVPA